VSDLARIPGFRRQGLDRAANCITIRESHPTPEGFVALYREEGPATIAIAKELGVSLD